MTLRVVELFAGIGAQAQALENLGIDFTSTVCEIDEKAYRSYCAIHGDTPNLGDITKVERLPDCDLLTYSFPCQDLSVAGNQRGMGQGSGTRSSLLWEVGRLLDDASEREREPEVLLMENVDAILNELNFAEFRKWMGKLSDLGYTSSYEVMNAKDYGVPQNRRRCFMVSMRDGRCFDFPEPCPDGRVLRDVLEDDVDESYYLTDDRVSKYRAHNERQRENGTGFGWRPSEPCGISPAVLTSPAKSSTNTIIITGNIDDPSKYEIVNRVYGTDGISPTMTTCQGGGQVPKIEIQDSIRYPCATSKGYMEAREGDGLVMNRPMKARGTVQRKSVPTLTTGSGCGTGVVDKGLRIRYLTPRECWRLMGFPDSAYEAARDVPTSKTQLYKQAGNSIAVPCLEAIFKAIYIDKTWHCRPSLEVWM